MLRSATVHSDKRRLLGSPQNAPRFRVLVAWEIPSVSDGWLNESAFRSFLLQETWRSLAQSLSHSWHLPGLLSSTWIQRYLQCQPGCRFIARRASATITHSGRSAVARGPPSSPASPQVPREGQVQGLAAIPGLSWGPKVKSAENTAPGSWAQVRASNPLLSVLTALEDSDTIL